ncbi:MAG: hypothetical protein NVSMB57_14390 [Actinomycetota bacterium]
MASEAGRKSAATLLLAIVAGIAGSAGAVALFGKGTYTVGPFRVALSVKPAASGTTTIGLDSPKLPRQGEATAMTHQGFLAFGARVVDVDQAGLVKATERIASSVTSPESFGHSLSADGQAALQSFGIKVGLIALGGGFAAGLAGALGNPKRAIVGAIAGVVVMAGLGLWAKQTYDVSHFKGVTFGAPAATK